LIGLLFWLQIPRLEAQVYSDLPSAPWVLRLILPTPEGRTDSGVRCEILASPDASLIGQIGHLSLKQAEGESRWTDHLYNIPLSPDGIDVQMDKRAEHGREQGLIQPERLDGLQNVSLLQSLAGARPKDDMIVRLDEVPEIQKTNEGFKIIISREPIQVAGPARIFVQFQGPVGKIGWSNSIYTAGYVRHYDPQARGFRGAIELIRFNLIDSDLDEGNESVGPLYRPIATLRGIGSHPWNEGGFFLYGRRDSDGIFFAEALVPADLYRLPSAQEDLPLLESQLPFRDAIWEDIEDLRATGEMLEIPFAMPAWNLHQGSEFLLLHTFGGNSASPRTFGFIAGHSSWGTARVERNPWTHEALLVPTYEQVYAHNSRGIISGRQDAAEYWGNFQRGNGWSRAGTDIAFPLPILTDPLRIKGQNIVPMDWIRFHLSEMMYRYRTGDGSGVAFVTACSSCAQDSNQAFLTAIEEFIRWHKSQTKDLELSPQDRTQIALLEQLALDYRREFGSQHLLPFLGNEPISTVVRNADSKTEKLRAIYWGLTRYRSLFPRAFVDRMFGVLRPFAFGRTLIIQTGLMALDPSAPENLQPKPPTSPLSKLRGFCRSLFGALVN